MDENRELTARITAIEEDLAEIVVDVQRILMGLRSGDPDDR